MPDDTNDFKVIEFPVTINNPAGDRVWETGSRRDSNVGKGRFDLISPVALRALALHNETGAAKYGDRNWEKGQPLMTYVDCAMRHLNKEVGGLTDENHAVAAFWNLMAYIHTLHEIKAGRLPASLDNRPKPVFP